MLQVIPNGWTLTMDQQGLVVRIGSTATEEEKVALHDWAGKLLEIRASSLPAMHKAQQAIALTQQSSGILPTVKIFGRELKRFAWDERSLKGRMGLGGAALGMAFFGGHGAGIAALGTAIGVPLWVVIGSGAAFAGMLVEEFGNKKDPGP